MHFQNEIKKKKNENTPPCAIKIVMLLMSNTMGRNISVSFLILITTCPWLVPFEICGCITNLYAKKRNNKRKKKNKNQLNVFVNKVSFNDQILRKKT